MRFTHRGITMNPSYSILLAFFIIVGCNDGEFTSSAGQRSNSGDLKKNKQNSSPSGQSDGNDGDDLDDNNDDGDDDDLDGDLGNDDDDKDSDGDIDGTDDETDGDDVNIEEGEASDKCDIPQGNEKQQTTLGGEDVPGNGLLGGPDAGKPFGSDFDDFSLSLNGTHLIEKDGQGAFVKIGYAKKTSVTVNYSRGTTDCAHSFKFMLRKCPNKTSTVTKTVQLNIGTGSTGSVTFDVPSTNLFLDIEITAAGSSLKKYGGCGLPIPMTNLLYGGGVPVLAQ